jgi:hypothetical protein
VTIEEEIVKMKIPRIEYIQPKDLLLLKVMYFRAKERKLSVEKRMEILTNFGWSLEKIAQYMMENEKPMLCEYSREELNEYRKNRKVPGESREEMEEAINREIERDERKLIKRYEGYLEIREVVNDPIEECKHQLRDQGNDEDELDELVDMHFGKV